MEIMKLYRCNECGQTMISIASRNKEPSCCNRNMNEIKPHTNIELFNDIHVPTYKVKGNKVIVRVGRTLHPMNNDHFIEWIAIRTNKGNELKNLKPGQKPIAVFDLAKDEYIEEVYAYCNVHSLWRRSDFLVNLFKSGRYMSKTSRT